METFTAVKQSCAGIKGSSLIDHKIRVKLGLSLAEYVVAYYLWQNRLNLKKALNVDNLWKELGVRNITFHISKLIEQGILNTQTGEFFPKWLDHFQIDDQWERLYEKFLQKGNKAESKRNLAKCLNMVSYEKILEAAIAYMRGKSTLPEDRQYILPLEKFLDPKMRRWEDNYDAPKEKQTYTRK